jgi:guanylate kinase
MLVMIGASASGKTEIAKILIKKYGFSKLVTYTTRAMRPSEVDGVDYHFISSEEFEKKKKKREFLETAQYNNTFYGSPKEGADENKVIIVDPKGANSIFRKKIPKTIFVYLETDQLIRRIRMLNRGDKLEDVEARFIKDKKHFRKSRFTHLDYIVNTSSHTLEELAQKIYTLYKNDIRNQD